MALRSDERQRKTGGFTLTEMAVVLGVIGAVLGGVWLAANAVINNSRIEQAAKDVMETAENIRQTYGQVNSSSYGNFTDISGQAAQAGLLPKDTLQPGSNAAITPWGGAFGLMMVDAQHFRVRLFGTTPAQCFGVASLLLAQASKDGPDMLVTACNNVQNAITPGVPPNKNTITQACNYNTGGCTSTEFNFKLH